VRERDLSNVISDLVNRHNLILFIVLGLFDIKDFIVCRLCHIRCLLMHVRYGRERNTVQRCDLQNAVLTFRIRKKDRPNFKTFIISV